MTFDDEGWYTCFVANSLGSSNSSAYLRVVDAIELDYHQPVYQARPHPLWLFILIIILSSSFLCAFGVMCCTYKKLKKEKQKKHSNMNKVNMITKKIVILRPNPYNTNMNGIGEALVKYIFYLKCKYFTNLSTLFHNSTCSLCRL